ncbi:MAG: hypothetical protein K5657_03245 [Desulfovibrio sp.]|nr:hypothetical protein [Desulfovibrio sp.]
MADDILYLLDGKGALQGVQLSVSLWREVESLVKPKLKKKEMFVEQEEGPLRDFETFMKYWDFPYPYSPQVTCPHCGASTDDWRKEGGKNFILTNANLGGLLVFHCLACGTTIRHKHFRDHVSHEHTVFVKK